MASTTKGIRRWRVDLGEGGSGSSALTHKGGAAPVEPAGYNSAIYLAAEKESDGSGSMGTKLKAEKDVTLKEQKAWEFAQSSVKQVGMFAFMMYMSGNSVHIFSIMMTFNGLYQPLMAIYSSGKAFERFQDSEGRVSTLAPRLLYCLIQLGSLGFALYKLSNIGLLPTHVSDWVSHIQTPLPMEYSAKA